MHKPQLFCYTYAGGIASFFDDLARDLDGIDTIRFEYAGHGIRHKEPFYRNFGELAEDAFSAFKTMYTGGRYALFGYSMGCISLVELLRIMIRHSSPLPEHVFLAAHDPLTRKELQGLSPDELDEWVKNRTIAFGAIPEKLISNNAFWRTYLPIFRADYGIISKYCFEDVDLQVDIPTSVFYSETDTPLTEMELWGNYFNGEMEYYKFDGPHFFMKQYHRGIAEIIAGKIR